jgi:hypothetical protein
VTQSQPKVSGHQWEVTGLESTRLFLDHLKKIGSGQINLSDSCRLQSDLNLFTYITRPAKAAFRDYCNGTIVLWLLLLLLWLLLLLELQKPFENRTCLVLKWYEPDTICVQFPNGILPSYLQSGFQMVHKARPF